MQTNVQNLITLPKWLTQGRIKTRRPFFHKNRTTVSRMASKCSFSCGETEGFKATRRFVRSLCKWFRINSTCLNQSEEASSLFNKSRAKSNEIRDLHFPAVGAGCMFELWAQIGDWHYLRLLWLARCAYSGFGSKFRSNPCFFTLICSLLHLKSLVIAFVESLYKFWSILFYHNYIFVFAFRRKLD